jgi:hypothetical protein
MDSLIGALFLTNIRIPLVFLLPRIVLLIL